MKGVCITPDGIAFHRTVISGRGPYVLPQAIDIEGRGEGREGRERGEWEGGDRGWRPEINA